MSQQVVHTAAHTLVETHGGLEARERRALASDRRGLGTTPPRAT
jgi:hypothetical protein